MKMYNSKIFDLLNLALSFIQDKLDNLRKNSIILSNLDIFILFFLLMTFVTSTFGTTNMIGAVSLFVPALAVLKTLTVKGGKIELERCNFYLLIYLFICFISNFTSSLPDKSLFGFMKTLIYIMFYFALCQFFKNNKKYIAIVFFVIALLISVESVIAVFQNTLGLENISTWQDTSYLNPEDVLTRVYGTLKPYNPNLLAGFLIAGFPCLISVFALKIKSKKYIQAGISFILALTGMLALFLTGCRGAYVALAVILAGIAAASYDIIFHDMSDERLKKIWKWLLCIFCLGAIGFLLVNHGVLHRIMSIFIMRGDSSTSFRMNVYNSSIQMFFDNWLLGIGVGNKVFREIYGLYMLSGFDALSCYCIYLEMAVESGIFALISYLMFAGSLLGSAVKRFYSIDDYYKKTVIFTAFISITAILVHGLVDTIYFRPQIQYLFWTMAAILTVSLKKEEAEEQ